VHTVVETAMFDAAAKREGLGEDEVIALIDKLSAGPEAGDVIPGTGGCRKLRLRAPGRGKSGGYRIVTFFSGQSMPLFLLTMYSKGRRADLSQKDRNVLRQLSSVLVESYRRRR
jgi:hypothetical protein